MRTGRLALGLLLAAPASAFLAPVAPPSAQAAVRPGLMHRSFAVPSPLSLRTSALQASKQDDDATPAAGPLSKLRQLLPSTMQTALFALAALSPLAAGMGSAEALPSGGRVGGSGFRSAPSQTRRYSSPEPSYSPPRASRGYVERVPVPVPVMPYAPIGGFGFGVSPYPSYGVSVYSGFNPLDVIILGAVAAGVFSILSNRISGSQWDFDDENPSSLGDGVTVVKLQVGLQVADRNSMNGILGQLDQLGKTADVSTREGLAQLVSATCLALLRTSGDWVAAHGEYKAFGRNDGKAETEYQRVAIRERSKFDREEDMMERRTISESVRAQSPYLQDSRPTLAVVTLCVAIRGQATTFKQLNNAARLREALQTLAADAMTDDGQNVLATEVLWSPQDDADVLTKKDLVQDYPELLDL